MSSCIKIIYFMLSGIFIEKYQWNKNGNSLFEIVSDQTRISQFVRR